MDTAQIYLWAAQYLPVVASNLIQSAIIFVVFAILYSLCSKDGFLVKMIAKKLGLEPTDAIVVVCGRILRIVIFVIGAISFAEAWGFNLGAVIASLGIGSLALALAAQDTAKNFFSTFVILLEKPFVLGDKISAGGVTGIVQEINFRSTVIKLDGGEVAFVPNANLSGAPITNFSRK